MNIRHGDLALIGIEKLPAGLTVSETKVLMTGSGGNDHMKIIGFTLDGYSQPFRFLNCFCPSTGREYFIETKQDTCDAAKATSFGFDEIVFDEEY